jgi:hypothetical protein
MFRKMTIVLAMAALVACSACNSVTGPTSDETTPVSYPTQSKTELSDADPGNGGGGAGADPRNVDNNPNTRRVRDGRIAARVELGDPGEGGGGSGEGAEPVKEERRPGLGRGDNEYDDGNGSGQPRRGGNGGR